MLNYYCYLYPGFDVGKVVNRGENGFALVLVGEVAMGGPVGCEGGREDKPVQEMVH